MHITGSKKMGEATFTFTAEAKDAKDALFQLAFLMEKDEVPTWKEGFESFKDKKVWFSVRKTKDDKIVYVERKCRDDKGRFATSTLGSYKEGGHFWHQWEIYNPDVPKGVNEPRGVDDF